MTYSNVAHKVDFTFFPPAKVANQYLDAEDTRGITPPGAATTDSRGRHGWTCLPFVETNNSQLKENGTFWNIVIMTMQVFDFPMGRGDAVVACWSGPEIRTSLALPSLIIQWFFDHLMRFMLFLVSNPQSTVHILTVFVGDGDGK